MDATPGTAIIARPWSQGRPLPDACRGLVIARWAEPGDVLVWFPARGLPTEAGRAVQPIRAHEIEAVIDLAECPPAWLTDAYDRARESRTLTELPTSVGVDLERAARAARQRRAPSPVRD